MSLARALLSLAACAAVAVLIAGGAEGGRTEAQILGKHLGGRLELKNSKQGRPIVTAPNISPGDVVRGRVGLRNVGGRGRLALARRRLAETPGPYGGLLSETLALRVMRVPPKSAPARRMKRTVWEGALADMREIQLRAWKPDTRRVYKFRVAFPDQGRPSSPSSGDNAYQGSRAEVAFVWR
jgi:hypothetical protein